MLPAVRTRPIVLDPVAARAVSETQLGESIVLRKLITTRVGFIAGAGEARDNPANYVCADAHGCWHVLDQREKIYFGSGQPNETFRIYPPWAAGDTVWVRETFGFQHYCNERDFLKGSIRGRKPEDIFPEYVLVYASDYGVDDYWGCSYWRPPVQMPRWASRLRLKVESVKAERLQTISNDEALPLVTAADRRGASPFRLTNLQDYAAYWDSHFPASPWQENPWVWKLKFTRRLGPAVHFRMAAKYSHP